MSGRDALPPLQCLRAFEAAARHGSFTQAGRELSLTQSAISRQIKRLEENLGRPLFERDPEGLRPTPAADQYYRVVRRLLRELADETVRLRRQGNDDQITLATSPTVASIWLSRHLPHFQRQHPEVEIRLLTMEDPYRLDLTEFDLGLYYHLEGQVDPPGLVAETVFSEEKVIAVCSPHYAAHHGHVDAPEDLIGRHILMVLEDHFHDWLTWRDWFEAIGMTWQEPAHCLRANSYQVLMNATLAGQGIALGWEQLLAEELRQGNLLRALPHAMPSQGKLSLLIPQHRHLSQASRTFREWLMALPSASRDAPLSIAPGA